MVADLRARNEGADQKKPEPPPLPFVASVTAGAPPNGPARSAACKVLQPAKAVAHNAPAPISPGARLQSPGATAPRKPQRACCRKVRKLRKTVKATRVAGGGMDTPKPQPMVKIDARWWAQGWLMAIAAQQPYCEAHFRPTPFDSQPPPARGR